MQVKKRSAVMRRANLSNLKTLPGFAIRMEVAPAATQDGTQPADPPPIRPTAAFSTVAEVEAEMLKAKTKAASFYQRAKEEGDRPLTSEERLSVSRHQEYYAFLKKEELPAVEKMEEMQRDMMDRELRDVADRSHRQTLATDETAHKFGLPRRYRQTGPTVVRNNLKAFRRELFSDASEAHEAATDAGHWLRAYLFSDKKSVQYCKDRPHLRLDRFDERMDAQTVDDSARGGVLVPEIVSRTIIDVRDRASLIASIARQYPMIGETDLVPKRIGGLSVYKPGEDAQITPSEKQFTNVRLSATDAYTLTHISHKLMRGSVVDAADQVINEIGYAFAKQQDYEGINGDGTAGSPNFGITGAITGASAFSVVAGPANWDVDTQAKIDAYKAIFSEMVGLLPDRFHGRANTGGENRATNSDACWVCSRAFYATVIEPVLENAGGNTKVDLAAASPYQLKGYPIKFTDQMPNAYATTETPLLFGNFYEAMLLGQREQVGIMASEHFRMDYDVITIRGRMAYDIKFHEKGDATNAGAIIKLVSA